MTEITRSTRVGATVPVPVRVPVPVPRATAHLDISMCTCGQDLDVHRSRHCPRCGITLRYEHPVIPAA